MKKKICLVARIWKGVINPRPREAENSRESSRSRESTRCTGRLQEEDIEEERTLKLRRVRSVERILKERFENERVLKDRFKNLKKQELKFESKTIVQQEGC